MRSFLAPATMLRLILALILCLSLLRTGLADESTDPYRILRKHYEAIGGLDRLQRLVTSHSEGRVRYDGLEGTFKHWDKRPLQYRTEEDYSVISQIEGDSGEFTWFFDTNGQLLVLRDEETLKRREIALRLDRYEHLDPDSPYFDVQYAGTVEIDGRPCHELILTNTINSDVGHFYYDAETMYMVKSIHKQPDMEIHSTYGDYRQVQGLVLSFYQHSRFLPWEKEEETWITRQSLDEPVPQDIFQPPPVKKDYSFLEGGTSATVPFQLMENLMYLPVTVAGDTGYWVLDSGASMSLIDAEYATKLGLDIGGSIKGYGFGDLFELNFVRIPEHQVGSILFGSQKFYVKKDLAARSYEPRINGILGYDFLSRFVVEVDYDRQKVTFHDPQTFRYQGPGVTIDAPLKYRTFSLPVTLDGRYQSLWTVDLGSYHSSIHYPFAEKHGLLDRSGVDIVSQGMAGLTHETNVQFDCLAIGPYRLDNPIVSIPKEKGKGATALGEVGGNLGNSTLRHFHLFLHYPKQQLIIEKGADFNRNFPPDRSGLLIGRSEINQPMVSFLAQDSPAVKAGLVEGDIIVEMAGKAIGPNHPVLPLRELLRGATGSTLEMKVHREDKTLPVTIVLQDMYGGNGQGCATAEKAAVEILAVPGEAAK